MARLDTSETDNVGVRASETMAALYAREQCTTGRPVTESMMHRFRRLGELRTPDTCGSGGGALTLLARDEDTAQLVTIKLLRRGSADVDNAANEILNMRACAAHPFIVRFKQVRGAPGTSV